MDGVNISSIYIIRVQLLFWQNYISIIWLIIRSNTMVSHTNRTRSYLTFQELCASTNNELMYTNFYFRDQLKMAPNHNLKKKIKFNHTWQRNKPNPMIQSQFIWNDKTNNQRIKMVRKLLQLWLCLKSWLNSVERFSKSVYKT